jgi:hypothetical protein
MCKQIATLNALDGEQVDTFTQAELAERRAMAPAVLPAWLAATL